MLTRYYRDVLNFCLRKARDRDTAADLAQESFVRVLTMQQAGQSILDPRALLRQVATNANIDLDRRAAVRQADSLDELDESAHPAAPRHLQPEEAYASTQAIHAYLRPSKPFRRAAGRRSPSMCSTACPSRRLPTRWACPSAWSSNT